MALLTWGSDLLLWGSDFLTWGPTPLSPPPAERPVAWRFVVGDGASATTPGQKRELTAARDRQVTWRVAGHAFASFTIDGRHEEAAEIIEHRSDVWVYRDGELLFRGRVVGVADRIDGDRHDCDVSIVDYRGLLGIAAPIESAVSFTAVDQGAIPWSLISTRQALPGGNYGITNGIGAVSGTLRDETDLTVGTMIADAIDRLSERDGGFEWEINELLELNRWHPRRGLDRGVVLDYGGLLMEASSTPDLFANVGVATGNEATVPARSVGANVATDQRGRWTTVQSFPSVSIQSTLAGKAAWLVAEGTTNGPSWSVRFAPGRWDGRDFVWLGDIVQLRIASGRLSVGGSHRVVEIAVTCGEDGTEDVVMGLVGA